MKGMNANAIKNIRPEKGIVIHERHEKTRKIEALPQNRHSPNRSHHDVVYFADLVRVFRAFRGQLLFIGSMFMFL